VIELIIFGIVSSMFPTILRYIIVFFSRAPFKAIGVTIIACILMYGFAVEQHWVNPYRTYAEIKRETEQVTSNITTKTDSAIRRINELKIEKGVPL